MPGPAFARRPLDRAARPGASRRAHRHDARTVSGIVRDPAHAALTPAMLVDLQRLAGNGAVATVVAGADVQRDDAESKGTANPPAAGTIDVVFVIQKPNDQFTKDMSAYVKSTLRSDVYVEVANVQEICEKAAALTAGGKKLRKIRFASHGQTVTGGVGMTPKGEKKWRYVQPDEVKAYMNSAECKGLHASLAKDAEVELWGCYVGASDKGGQSWADFWGAPMRSTKGEMKIGHDEFITDKGTISSSKNVPKARKKDFEKWLVERYNLLRATGEAPFLQTRDEQIAHMTAVFDAGGGKVRSRVVQEKGMSYVMRPGEKGEADLWESFTPSKP
jgi:hypothetical protein